MSYIIIFYSSNSLSKQVKKMSTTIIDTLKNAITNLFNWESAQQQQQNNTQGDNNKQQQQQQPAMKMNSQHYQTNSTNDKLANPPYQTISLKPQHTEATTQKVKAKTTASVINYIKNYLVEEQVQCMICLMKFRKPGVVKFCFCEHLCCRICLKEYMNAKLNTFAMPKCPQQACLANIDKQSGFFRSLGQKTRQLFDKVEKFYFISNDPFLKMCPNENCHGIIPVIEDQPYQCLQCQNQFCKKCMYLKHKGKCTNNQAQILNIKYNFTKCNQCQIIVQKTQACDHMTCKCGYQFCYRCGRKWVGAHHCKPPVKKKNTANNGSGQQQQGMCFKCVKFIFKLFVTLFFLPFIIIWIILVLLLGLIAGISFYTLYVIIEKCKSQSPCLGFLLIILFPFAILWGVFTAFNQYWGEMFFQSIKVPYQMLCDN